VLADGPAVLGEMVFGEMGRLVFERCRQRVVPAVEETELLMIFGRRDVRQTRMALGAVTATRFSKKRNATTCMSALGVNSRRSPTGKAT
jgi:hypothetical protein